MVQVCKFALAGLVLMAAVGCTRDPDGVDDELVHLYTQKAIAEVSGK